GDERTGGRHPRRHQKGGPSGGESPPDTQLRAGVGRRGNHRCHRIVGEQDGSAALKRDRAYRLWLTTRFFRIGAVAIALCALGFAFPAAFVVGQATSFLLLCAAVVDGYMLF